jgi:uncharacterized protein (DUF58 family)
MRKNALDEIRHLRQIEVKTKKLVKDLFSGAWASLYKGQGIEPEDLRAYAPEDPIRFIDWHVTARAGKPYIRLFKEERQLTVLLLVDASASILFGDKRDQLAEMASLIAFSALQNGDKVGLLFFSSKIEKYISPKSGSTHILPLVQELLYFQPTKKGTNMQLALETVARMQKKRCALFLFSDFLFEVQPILLKIMAKKYDFVGINLNDPLEKKMQNMGWIRMQDLEKGNQVLINTSDPTYLSLYDQKVSQLIEQSRTCIEKGGGSFISLSSQDSVSDKLIEFFEKKRRQGS